MATKTEQELLRTLVEQQAEFQHKALTTIESIVQRFAETQAETNKVLQTWLEGFKITELPKSTVRRDEDIIALEKDRYRALGYDVPETDLPGTAEEGIAAMLKGL